MRPLLIAIIAGISLAAESAARRQLQVPPELFLLRSAIHRAFRCDPRPLARGAPDCALSSLASGRLRPSAAAAHRFQATDSWLNPRIYLWIALALLAWMNLVQWSRDNAGAVRTPATTSAATTASAPAAAQAAPDTLPSLPSAAPAPAPVTNGATTAAATPGEPVAAEAGGAPRVHVVTDVLDIDLSLQGGEIVRADLPGYPRDKQPGSPPVRLLDTDPSDYSVIRSGLRAAAGRSEPTHLVNYTADASEYRLAAAPTSCACRSGGPTGRGSRSRRRSSSDRVATTLSSTTTSTTRPELRGRARRTCSSRARSTRASGRCSTSRATHTAVLRFTTERRYRKLNVDDEDDAKFKQAFGGGWMAEMRHHFVSAAVPPVPETYDYSLMREGDHSLISYRGPLKSVEPGAKGRFTEKMFVGPKLQQQLKTVGPKLELTADYGKLTILAQPLFWLLEKVHSFVRNWGLAIILVTILLKLVFYKLTETSGRSMAKMRTIAPRIKNIQERYKDDREQLCEADDGALQAREDQPCRGMPADRRADPGLPRVLLGAARKRRDAAGAFHGLDPGPLVKGPVLRAAGPDGRRDVRSVQAQPAAAGPVQAKVFASCQS
jgi:YidC/Oxa1 family membrane protein insertase